ncbi:unnamed protein product [Ambrosiozyma monospora]|uniref:Unnamed protein product n=1 Tax=Ambrosiozyma monospora TaxID=43982 RepID=A0A9W7DCS3_AMBMO|nr:unnamed protein product [Ambrosiozyma monospora]
MWGIKTGVSKTRQKQHTHQRGIDTSNIPGFSKWFANEVYVESKLIETGIEQMSLKMKGNNDWLNSLMADVLNGETELSEDEQNNHDEESIDQMPSLENSFVDTVEDEVENVFSKTGAAEVTKSDEQEVSPKSNVIKSLDNKTSDNSAEEIEASVPVEGKSHNHISEDGDISLLGLRSPKKMRNYEKSPLKKLYDKNMQLTRHDTALLISNSPQETPEKNRSVVFSPTITSTTATTTTMAITIPLAGEHKQLQQLRINRKNEFTAVSPTSNTDDNDYSFEDVRSNIRKSIAAQAHHHAVEVEAEKEVWRSSDEDKMSTHHDLSELENQSSTIESSSGKSSNEESPGKSTSEESPSEKEVTVAATNTTAAAVSASVAEPKTKEQEQIQEISRLLERDEDEDDFDDNIGFEKIEIVATKTDTNTTKFPSINNSTTPKTALSSIKFVEFPSREPLTVKSKKKKSLRKSIRKSTASRKLELDKSPATAVARGSPVKRVHKSKKNLHLPKNILFNEKRDFSPFDDDSNAKSVDKSKTPFELALPPSYSQLEAEADEPTIPIKRNLRKTHDMMKVKQKLRAPPTEKPTANTNNATTPHRKSNTGGADDLVSRLMMPTQSSAKRSTRKRSITPSRAKHEKTPTHRYLLLWLNLRF